VRSQAYCPATIPNDNAGGHMAPSFEQNKIGLLAAEQAPGRLSKSPATTKPSPKACEPGLLSSQRRTPRRPLIALPISSVSSTGGTATRTLNGWRARTILCGTPLQT
jgi:hypothetical protein